MLKSKIVTEEHEVEIMRLIFNENIKDLSTSTLTEQTKENQLLWFYSLKDVKCYLYFNEINNVVGFLTLRYRDGFTTPTFAIFKKYWGKGYGKEIVKDYIIKANTPLAGAQLKSNNAIRYINSLNGWEVIGETEKLELLYHPGQIKNKIKEYLHERYKS